MKQNEQFKSKCHGEAKTQWCKCEIFLNLGMTNCINCNISESLREIWAGMGLCFGVWLGGQTCALQACNSPKFHLSPEVVVRQGQPTGTRLHHFPSKPVFTFSRCCLPCKCEKRAGEGHRMRVKLCLKNLVSSPKWLMSWEKLLI